MDLKQNAFLRQWISPHQHREYTHFFTINALWEYFSSKKDIQNKAINITRKINP